MAPETVIQRTRARVGFTLLEMLLVLAVVGVFMSMTVPSVLRIFHQEKLTESAEKVRAAAAMARVRSIETGLIYQFCCEINGTHFVVLPYEPDHLNMSSGNSGSGTVNSNSPNSRWGRFTGNLPHGISLNSASAGLAASSVMAGNAYHLSSTSLDGLPNANDLSNLNWANPVLFNSNGSANLDSEIIVSDGRAQKVRIRIRAFTGAATMSRIYTEKR